MDSPRFEFLPQNPIEKCYLNRRSSMRINQSIHKKIEKLQIQRSRYLLLTLKEEDHAHASKSRPSIGILMKNDHINGGRGGKRRLLG